MKLRPEGLAQAPEGCSVSQAITISKLQGAARIDTPLGKLRRKHGVLMRDVSRHSGVSLATVCRAESGKPVDIVTALKLARFYESTVEDLFGRLLEAPRP
jgi:DNA-binding XRE family transcriptional regulator